MADEPGKSQLMQGLADYPHLPKSHTADKYKSMHGDVSVADPFRLLEDPESPDTKKWADEEKKLTDSFFKGDENLEKINESM